MDCLYLKIEKRLGNFHGNNKGIIGLDDDFIVMSFKECMEYIHPDFIDILINGIKCNLLEYMSYYDEFI